MALRSATATHVAYPPPLRSLLEGRTEEGEPWGNHDVGNLVAAWRKLREQPKRERTPNRRVRVFHGFPVRR
jgi:hypothetical protein